MPGTCQEVVLNPFRSSTATNSLQKDSNHKSSSMWRIANACRLCAPACCPSQVQTSSNKATASTRARLSNCTYANVRQPCCHGTLNPSRKRFIQQVGNKVKCFQGCMGHRRENHFLARYLTCAPWHKHRWLSLLLKPMVAKCMFNMHCGW
jgi:hypothetical protein